MAGSAGGVGGGPGLFGRYQQSDLNEEDLEELRMLSGFAPAEIHRLRCEFLKYTSGDHRSITTEEFLNIPTIAINPLKHRIAFCFELTAKPSITFQDFIIHMAEFNGDGKGMEQKLKLAFRLQDFDGDGRLSKSDLVRYLEAVSDTLEGTTLDHEEVADEILNELSTEEDRFVSYESFQRVVAPTEFETKLRLAI